MKIGIKISIKDFDLIPEINQQKDKIDFVEIILLPEFTKKDIYEIKKLEFPYVIHFPSSSFGFNPGDPDILSLNLEYIRKINKLDHLIDPTFYIVHPEFGDLDLSIRTIKKISVKSLLIENMPLMGLNGSNLLGYNQETIESFFDQIDGLGFCFDINHAIKSAIALEVNPRAFIMDFISFKKPNLFHLADGNTNSALDEHLHLGEGKYEMKWIKKILIKHSSPWVTLETPRDSKFGLRDNLEDISYFKSC